MEEIPEVNDRSRYLIQSKVLLEELKVRLKRRLELSPKKRIESITPLKAVFGWFIQCIVFLPLLIITGGRIIIWLDMKYLQTLFGRDKDFVAGLSKMGMYLDFIDGLKGNLRIFEKMSVDSPISIVDRNRFIAELDRILFYTRRALKKNKDKVRVKVHAAGIGLSALMALMILRDENSDYMERLEFTITDLEEKNVQKIKEIAVLCGLERNVHTFVENIEKPATKEGIRYQVQSAVGVLSCFDDYEIIENILRNMQRVSAPDGAIIVDYDIPHFTRYILQAIRGIRTGVRTKVRNPQVMLNLTEKVGLKAGSEYDRYPGCPLYGISPVMVFENATTDVTQIYSKDIPSSIVNLTMRLTLDTMEAREDGLYLLDSRENATPGIRLNGTEYHARRLREAGFNNLKVRGIPSEEIEGLLRVLDEGTNEEISRRIGKLGLEHNIEIAEPLPFPKISEEPGEKRILFFIRTKVLAHVLRNLEIAKELRRLGYRVIFIGRDTYKIGGIDPIEEAGFDFVNMICIDGDYVLSLAKKGNFAIYEPESLGVIIDEQLRLIKKFNPIAAAAEEQPPSRIAARIAGIPYISPTNAYWTVYTAAELRAPDNHFLMRIIRKIWRSEEGRRRAERIAISRVAPRLLKKWAKAFLEFAKERCLPEDWVRPNIREVIYGSDDLVVCLDPRNFARLKVDAPDHVHQVGPIVFDPKGDLPDGWESLLQEDKRKITVYFTIGSTAGEDQLDILSDPDRLNKLGSEVMKKAGLSGNFLDKFQFIVSGKDAERLRNPDIGIFAAEFIPGLKAANLSDVVVFHGGYQTAFQVLAAGKPIVVILPQWWDQEYTLHWARDSGIGEGLFPREFTLEKFLEVLIKVATDERYSREAEKVRRDIESYRNPAGRAAELIDELLTKGPTTPAEGPAAEDIEAQSASVRRLPSWLKWAAFPTLYVLEERLHLLLAFGPVHVWGEIWRQFGRIYSGNVDLTRAPPRRQVLSLILAPILTLVTAITLATIAYLTGSGFEFTTLDITMLALAIPTLLRIGIDQFMADNDLRKGMELLKQKHAAAPAEGPVARRAEN